MLVLCILLVFIKLIPLSIFSHSACGLPSNFVVQFNGLTGDFAEYNGQYGTLFPTGDDFGTELMSAGPIGEAQTFANDNAAGPCALTGNSLLANTDNTNTVYFNPAAETDGFALPSCRGGAGGVVSCSATVDDAVKSVLAVCPVVSLLIVVT